MLILNLFLQLFLSLGCCKYFGCFLHLKMTCLKLADLTILILDLAASVLYTLFNFSIICVVLISLYIVFQKKSPRVLFFYHSREATWSYYLTSHYRICSYFWILFWLKIVLLRIFKSSIHSYASWFFYAFILIHLV